MMAFEKRWARHLLAAFAPPEGPGLAPAPGEVDYLGVLARMVRGASPWAALGLRLAIWIAALAPLWLWGKVTTISKLAAERRTQLLRELLGHRAFVVRELTLLLKLSASMALLGTPTVRARSGYDQVETAPEPARPPRVRLPLVAVQPAAVEAWPVAPAATEQLPQTAQSAQPPSEAP